MATFWPGLTPAGQVIQKHAVPGGDGGIAAWFGASAKEGDNVNIAVEAMVAEVVQDDDVSHRQISCDIDIDPSVFSCHIS